jgi:hypothetical protein
LAPLQQDLPVQRKLAISEEDGGRRYRKDLERETGLEPSIKGDWA